MEQGFGRGERLSQSIENQKSNMPLLIVAAGFLVLTIALITVQSLFGSGSDTPVAVTPTAPAPVVAATSQTPETTSSTPLNGPLAAALRAARSEPTEPETPTYDLVTRAQMPLLSVSFTPLDRITSASITEQLRQPIRLIDTGVPKRDLPQLTDEVLTLLSPEKRAAPAGMQTLLNEAVRQRQSDAYIRVLLNEEVGKGSFDIPPTLRTTKGTFDAYSMLKAMAMTAGAPIPKIPDEVDTYGTQKIVPGDSLARLALRYYGQPLKYHIILAANPQIDPENPVLTPGDVIQMPKP